MLDKLTLKAGGRKVGLLLVSLMIASSVMIGGAAAFDSSTNEGVYTQDINQDTESVFIDVSSVAFSTEAGGTSNYTVSIIYKGVNESAGTTSELKTDTLTMTSGATKTSEYQITDTETQTDYEEFDSVEVTLTVDNVDNSDLIDGNAAVGTLVENLGGGGGGSGGLSLSGDIAGIPSVLVIGGALIAGFVLMRDD